ncbi:unnamed protein product [Effrenium voratum]|uniref:SAC domain-containing protein n=1 Tax=Effrenium voratum TaxID=2562239 RepID=A0AA36HUI8_9DINO|nr:unnamed protein product [Effrenium voratum]
MPGFAQCQELPGPEGKLLLVLLARRSRRHAGTRYNARGLDDDGEAANWVETEMLVKLPGNKEHWLALTQVRGSAPVFWEQRSSGSNVTVTRGFELASLGFQKHEAWMQREYGDSFYVSLLSQAGNKRDTEGLALA